MLGKSDPCAVTGLRVIVTGSGRGLGRAIALGLGAAGCRVGVAGRTEVDVTNTVADVLEKGGDAIAIGLDALNDASCEAMVHTMESRYGGIDGIVVNHGITHHARAEETTSEAFRHVVEVNLCSAFACARAAGKALIQSGGGSIVFVSSTASFVAFDGLSAYAASKGGVDQLVRQLAHEWAPYRVRVNAIGPGWMNSHMRGVEAEYEAPEFRSTVENSIPMGRRGEPAELVGPVAMMLSSASSYMTGQYIAIDGGHSLG